MEGVSSAEERLHLHSNWQMKLIAYIYQFFFYVILHVIVNFLAHMYCKSFIKKIKFDSPPLIIFSCSLIYILLVFFFFWIGKCYVSFFVNWEFKSMTSSLNGKSYQLNNLVSNNNLQATVVLYWSDFGNKLTVHWSLSILQYNKLFLISLI